MIAVEERYGNDWNIKSVNTKRSQQRNDGKIQCASCGGFFDWENTETHHAYYLGSGDTPGLNLFAVCGNTQSPGTCHHRLHRPGIWNRETGENDHTIIKKLQANWKTIVGDSHNTNEIKSDDRYQQALSRLMIPRQPVSMKRRDIYRSISKSIDHLFIPVGFSLVLLFLILLVG